MLMSTIYSYKLSCKIILHIIEAPKSAADDILMSLFIYLFFSFQG